MADIFELFKKIQGEKKETTPIKYIIAGLGNPDEKYRNTRHNAGFLCLSHLAKKQGFEINRVKFRSLYCDAVLGGERCLFMLPQTYMNNSGEAIREAADFYNIPVQNIIVVYDDISLEVGKMRIRRKGSAGGHNGIKSIIEHIGSQDFPRIKLGVGEKPHPEMELADWVLSSFTSQEKDAIVPVFDNAIESLKLIVGGEIDKAMNNFSK